MGLEVESVQRPFGYSLIFATVVMIAGIFMIRRVKMASEPQTREFHYENVERIFAILMVITACSMAFAHGSNDVANAVGPVAAVISIVDTGHGHSRQSPLPVYVSAHGRRRHRHRSRDLRLSSDLAPWAPGSPN